MTKPRRNVKFQHRGNHDGRRESFSSISEASEPGSPTLRNGKTETMGKGEPDIPLTPFEKKKQAFVVRTIWTFVMVFGFVACVGGGHIYMIAICTAIQILTFKEVISISNVPSRARKLRFTKSLNWYFLAASMYYFYGESIIYYFKHIVLVDRILLPFATHHRFISFSLYIFGFVFFVANLQKGHYRFQFTQFAWTHMALYLIVVQAHFVMNNIFEGMIWFLLPAALVITNDIWAYLCGITFGRTPLIKISPNKTVEGFVGAWVFTVGFGILMTHYMMQYQYFICPVTDLGSNIWTGLQCNPNPVFIPRTYRLPDIVASLPFIPAAFHFAPMQLHVVLLATFASLIAPFGGFFASGLKRTFKIKDFGDTIPGHGGITDRMDCQFIMGFFTFMYYQSFIAVYKASVGGLIEQAIIGLTIEEQIEVVRGLSKHLYNQGVLSDKVLGYLNDNVKR